MAKWALLPYRLGLGFLLARQVMILTTRGRATGRLRKTPLWYVRDGGAVYCFSGWGASSDWWRNLKAEPSALAQIGKRRWRTGGVFVREHHDLERVLGRFREKYGRLVPVFYHLDRLDLVYFPLDGSGELPATETSPS
jgi:deazaflavin-dependent oxidoreductase (nitroreductase family)